MERIIRRVAILACAIALGGPAFSQQSASFLLEVQSFNAGGNAGAQDGGSAVAGVVLLSPGFRITQSAIGDAVSTAIMVSPGFTLTSSLISINPPPAEVRNVRFRDTTMTVVWDMDPSVGRYHLYQGGVAVPFDPGFGSCVPPAWLTEQATVTADPPPGEAIFVFLTAANTLDEESTKGFRSDGVERLNPAPCP